jgi:hypothetical protein
MLRSSVVPVGSCLERRAERWRRLALILSSLERAVAGASRLDVYRPALPGPAPRVSNLDATLARLAARIDRELDRLTADLLTARLSQQQQRKAS